MTLEAFTVDECARRAKVHVKTVRRAIDRGDLQAAPLGEDGALRILSVWFEEWFANRARFHAERRAAARVRRAKPVAQLVRPAGREKPQPGSRQGDQQRGRLVVHEGMGKRA